ncbi:PAS domain S-box protein [Aquiflexum sp.]|uniref:PAS domain S-box protein n=1 Tax=Aquiflexum sp. TaxID=1872584 RepID=UPI00359417F1
MSEKDKKDSNKKLEITDKLFRAIVENCPDAFVIVDTRITPIYISPGAQNIVGYTEEEALNLDSFQTFHPDDISYIKEKLEVCFQNPGMVIKDLSYRIRHKLGHWIWVEATITNLTEDPVLGGILVNFRDVTDRKLMELQLTNITDNVNGVVFRYHLDLDLKDRLLYLNKNSIKLWGVEAKDAMDDINLIWSKIHPEDVPEMVQSIYRSAEMLEDWTWEWRFNHPDGSLRWQKGNATPQRLPDGSTMWDVIIVDITAVKSAEEKLKEINERYQYVLKATNDAIWDWKLGDNKVFWGDTYIQLFGEIPAPGHTDLEKVVSRLHPEEVGDLIRSCEETIKSKVLNWSYEHRYLKANGEFAYVSNKAAIIRDDQGKAIRVIGAMSDITQRKESTEAIGKSEERQKLIMNAALDAIVCINMEGMVTFWNPQAEKVFGWKEDEAKGKKLSELIMSHNHRKLHEKGMENYQKTGEGPVLNRLIELPAIRKNGEEFTVELTILPIRQDQEEFFCAFIRDITERKSAESKLHELNTNLANQTKELEASNQELEQFAYVASHDLQEPLRMISSFMQQLDNKYGNSLDDRGRKYIHFAVDGANRMRQIIQDLLEFSKVGKTEKNTETIDLNELLADIKILFRKEIADKNALLEIGEIPQIQGPQSPMRQVFQNLIGNALKYSLKDVPVKIKIRSRDMETHWQFAVQDNGIGIPEGSHDKIFEIFKRLHTKEEYEGTGMGLAITKKIVENMGGKIWVESEPGSGSTFFFTLPKNQS